MKPTSPEQSIADWTTTAQAVLRGEYDKADNSTKCSLLIGLNAVANKECLRAAERLQAKENKRDSMVIHYGASGLFCNEAR